MSAVCLPYVCRMSMSATHRRPLINEQVPQQRAKQVLISDTHVGTRVRLDMHVFMPYRGAAMLMPACISILQRLNALVCRCSRHVPYETQPQHAWFRSIAWFVSRMLRWPCASVMPRNEASLCGQENNDRVWARQDDGKRDASDA